MALSPGEMDTLFKNKADNSQYERNQQCIAYDLAGGE
jgi:hypothetical protein